MTIISTVFVRERNPLRDPLCELVKIAITGPTHQMVLTTIQQIPDPRIRDNRRQHLHLRNTQTPRRAGGSSSRREPGQHPPDLRELERFSTRPVTRRFAPRPNRPVMITHKRARDLDTIHERRDLRVQTATLTIEHT